MFWKKIAPVHRPPGVCCPSAGCCVLLLFNVATVTVRFISLGAQRLLGCIFYAWNVTPRKRGGGGGVRGAHRVQVEQLIFEWTRANSRLNAYLLNRHDITTGVMEFGPRLLLLGRNKWGCKRSALRQWHLSSSDTFACSLLTPTAFLPSVSVLFLWSCEFSEAIFTRSIRYVETWTQTQTPNHSNTNMLGK